VSASDQQPASILNPSTRLERLFPTLTSAQIARVAARGRRRPVTRDEILVEVGLESSRPGVFAVGDVRGGNIKRVASAVGEGSIAVAFVHQVLQQ
jgi:thioredoxin reductase